MSEKPRIFLSAVTKELGSCRDELARVLRMRGCEVAVQEEFRTTSGTLLEKLHDYILECHAVICLMGERYGGEPPSTEATRYAFSFTRDDADTGATPRHSYTQWEYLFGRRMNKATYVFLPSKKALRDPGHAENPETEELRQMQQRFIQKDVRLDGRDRTYFDSVEQLKDHLAAIDFQKLLHAEFHQVPLKEENPYVGLRHFEETERDYFFGRDRLVAELLAASEESSLLLVLGASGSGKSSAVRAGVIPAWRDRAKKKGRVIVFTPDEDPFEGFYLGLSRAGFSQPEAKPAKEVSAKVIRERCEALRKPGEPWLIFIDQFEEIFTRTPRREDAQKDLRAFVASLVDVATDPPKGLRVVLAMRDDFFSNLEGHPELCAITDENFHRVRRMDESELRSVIRQPAAAHGVAFEPGLVRRIIEDVGDPRGRVPLPLLEYTLEALWEKDDVTDRVLNLDSYEAIGGVRGALQQRVTDYYEGLGEDEKQSLRRILLRLVEIGETEVPVSRAARKADLAIGADADSDAVVLEQLLSREKLLVAQEGADEGRADSVVELAHEALITGWNEFEKWVNESREAITLRNRLREDAEGWARLRGENKARATAELWTGSRLERALELDEDQEFERIGGLSQSEQKFLNECLNEKKSKVRLLRIYIGVLCVLAVCALIASVAAVGWASDAEQSNQEANLATGRAHLARAEHASREGKSLEALFYAGRAIGYRGFGFQDGVTLGHRELPAAFLNAHNDSSGVRKAHHMIRTADTLPYLWSSSRSLHTSFIDSISINPISNLIATVCSNRLVIWNWEDEDNPVWFEIEELGLADEVEWSPNGVLLACLDTYYARISFRRSDGAENIRPIYFPASEKAVAFAWSPDSSQIACGMEDGAILLFTLGADLPEERIIAHNESIRDLAWSVESEMLASSSNDNTVKVWDLTGSQDVAKLELDTAVESLDWIAQSGELALTSGKKLLTWHPQNSGASRRSTLDGSRYWDVKSSHGGARFAALTSEFVEIWEFASQVPEKVIGLSKQHSDEVAWSADDSMLVIPRRESLVFANTETGEKEFEGRSKFKDVEWSPDGRFVLSSREERISIFDFKTGRERPLLETVIGEHVAWSPDGESFAVVYFEENWILGVFQVDTLEVKKISFPEHPNDEVPLAPSCLKWSPSGDVISIGSFRGLYRWSIAENEWKDAGTGSIVNSLDYSPDGETLAIGYRGDRSKGETLVVTRSKNNSETFTDNLGEVIDVFYSEEGDLIAVAETGERVCFWEISQGGRVVPVAVPGGVSSARISLDGEHVFVARGYGFSGERDVFIDIVDRRAGDIVRSYGTHEGRIVDIDVSPDGAALTSVAKDGTLKIWDVSLNHGEEMDLGADGGIPIASLQWSRDGSELLVAGRSVRVIDPVSGVETVEIQGVPWEVGNRLFNSVREAVWSPGGKWIAAQLDDGNDFDVGHFWTWDAETGRPVDPETVTPNVARWAPVGHSATTRFHRGYRLHPSEESRLLAIPRDRSIRVSDADTSDFYFHGHRAEVSCLEWNADQSRLASGSLDGEIRVWDRDSRKLIATLHSHVDRVSDLRWNGDKLLSGSMDGTMVIWDIAKEKPEEFVGGLGKIRELAWSITGKIAAGFEDGTVKIWDELPSAKPNLYRFIRDDYLEFDEEDGTLIWKNPAKGNEGLQGLSTAHSFTALGILQNENLDDAGTNWRLYLRALSVENWKLAEVYHARLADEKRRKAEPAVRRAGIRIRSELIGFLKDGRANLAAMRFSTAFRILNEIPRGNSTLFSDMFSEPFLEPSEMERLSIGLARTIPERKILEVCSRSLSAAQRESLAGQILDARIENLKGENKFEKLEDALREVEPWRQSRVSRWEGVSLKSLLKVARIVCNSDAQGAKEIREEIDPLLDTLLDEESGETRASALRSLALLREGEARMRTLSKLVAMEEAGYDDFRFAGYHAAESGDADSLNKFFEAALQRHPSLSGWLNYHFARCLRILGSDAEALARLEEARDDPSGYYLGPLLNSLAEVLKDLGRVEEAIGVYRDMLNDVSMVSIDDLRDAGYFLAGHGAEEANEFFEKALEKCGDDAERQRVLRMKGWAAINLGNHEKALRCFLEVLTLGGEEIGSSEDSDAIAGTSISYWLNGKHEEAINTFRKLVSAGLSEEKPKNWTEAQTINDLKWKEAEKTPLEQVRSATLERFPELRKVQESQEGTEHEE